MAATQVTVQVVHGVTVVEESVRRPLRLTPDGYAGVAYGGAVYPLRDGIVDTSESSWEIADCNRFLLAGTPIPYAPGSKTEPSDAKSRGFAVDWYIESNRFGHYVVFNAAERLAVDIIEALEGAGLSVQRWDVSHRRAADGQFYDWFARLRFKGSRDQVVDRVAAVMSPAPTTPPLIEVERDPSELRIEELEAQVETLLDQLVLVQEALTAAGAETQDLRLAVKRGQARESRLESDVQRALSHQASLREELVQLRDAASDSSAAKELVAKQADTEELLEFALAENAGLSADVATLQTQSDADARRIRELQGALDDLTARLSELSNQDRERRRSVHPTRGPRIGAEGFILLAFSRLEFVHDSVEVLANFESPAAAMRVLTQIDMGGSIGKDLEGIRGWREVSKVATGVPGSEDLGRIYYKPDGERVLVSLHLKQDDKEQRRHVDRLRAL